MVLNEVNIKATSWCFLIICLHSFGITGVTQDQTSTRPNTLLDEADDIERQLDNEARDRINYGRPKTIWVLNFPTQIPVLRGTIDRIKREPMGFRNICQKCRRKVASGREAPSGKQAPLCDKETADDKEPLCCKDLPCCKEPSSNNDTKDTVEDDWNYNDPTKWCEKYPHCGSRSQSPVDLPVAGHQKVDGAHKLRFCNYDVKPQKLTIQNDGRSVTLFGEWRKGRRPLVYGGAAHTRRYLFYCLIIHWPSEHTVGGLTYPLEAQALHVSADYGSFEQAVEAATRDQQAFLVIVNIYKFGAKTHAGLQEILKMAVAAPNETAKSYPLSTFVPPFKSYVCYQGSLTFPPCTESVLWLIRPKAFSVSREAVEAAHNLLKSCDEQTKFFVRPPQPLNDRKIYYFN